MKLSFWKKVYNKLCVGTILTTFDRIFWKPYNIMNAKETIDYIVKNQCSVARFGDGEFSIALIVKVVVSKNIYFLFVQVIRYCSVPDHHHFE